MTNNGFGKDIFQELAEESEARSELYEIRVLHGLHAGAVLSLTSSTLTIGSGVDCDVVLLDEGVAPEHLHLKWLEGDGWCVNGERTSQISDAPLALGHAVVMVCRPHLPWPTQKEIADFLSSSATSVQRPANSLASIISTDIPSDRNSKDVTPRSAALRTTSMAVQVKRLGLFRWMLVGVLATGTVLIYVVLSEAVSATEGPDTGPAVSRPPQVFEAKQDATDDADTALDKAPRIKAVVFGSSPYVVLPNGDRAYVGDSVDGVMLAEISQTFVAWQGKRRVEVKW